MAAGLWKVAAERLTEQDWLDADEPELPLFFVTTEHNLSHRKFRLSNRKLRLFGCACCRRIWSDIPEGWPKNAALFAEAAADGLAGDSDLRAAFSAAPESLLRLGGWHVHRVAEAASAGGDDRAIWALVAARDVCALDGGMSKNDLPEQMRRSYCPDRRAKNAGDLAAQAVLLKDICGNPFQSAAFNLECRSSVVAAIARSMYETRDFTAMPILADALADAGCDDEPLLSHCRGPGPHVRGCWVVDLVLGKE